MSELEDKILNIAQTAMSDSVKAVLTSYNSPLHKLTEKVVSENSEKILVILREAMASVIDSDDFKNATKSALIHKLAKSMLSGIEGQVDKLVQQYKQDPGTKARMIIAIENVLKEIQSETVKSK